jgi:hypothetical protein
MGKKSPPPKPPDLTPVSNAQLKIAEDANNLAREQLGLSREQYAWFKENAAEELELARTQADRLFEFQNKAFESDEEMKAFSRQIGQTQMDAMNLQMDFAKRDRERYEKVFLPMQDKFIKEANEYDTPARREAEAGKVMVDVQRQADAQRANADARLRSMGLDPSQTRSTSMMNQMGVATAANQALAGNMARTQVEDKGRALRADAINLGMGLPAQSAMNFGQAGQSGQGAINAAGAGQGATLAAIQAGAGVGGTAMGFRSNALNNVAALTGSPMQWAQMGSGNMGMAGNMYGSAANTMTQGFNNSMSSWKAGQEQAQQQFNNVMSVASMAGGMMMAEGGDVSKKAKGKKPAASGKAALDIVQIAQELVKPTNPTPMRKPIGDPRGSASPSLDERFMRGADMASQQAAGATNVWEGQDLTNTSQNMQAIPQNPTQLPMYAEGGDRRARGALPVRQARDTYEALLAEGEYVVPADVVRSKGVEFFDRLVSKYHRENA